MAGVDGVDCTVAEGGRAGQGPEKYRKNLGFRDLAVQGYLRFQYKNPENPIYRLIKEYIRL